MAITMTMNVSLPENMKNFVEERVESGGYSTASEYIRELIRADQKRREQEQLETLLQQRLQNGSERELDLLEVKREMTKRLAERKQK